MLPGILKEHYFTDINKLRRNDFVAAQLSRIKSTIERVD